MLLSCKLPLDVLDAMVAVGPLRQDAVSGDLGVVLRRGDEGAWVDVLPAGAGWACAPNRKRVG